MKNIYAAKNYLEEILLGSNNDGIGFVNESAYSFFQKSFSFLGNTQNINYADELISVGLLNGNLLEIGVSVNTARSKEFCDCFKHDLCRRLTINHSFVRVTPKKQYYPHLVLNPGNRVGHTNLARNNSYGSLGFFLLPYKANQNPLIISNNHVLADSNNANIGDAIYYLDGNPAKIGTLKNYVPIYPSDENRLDLAIAELHGFDSPVPTKTSGYRSPLIGEKVYKTGATTGLTHGIVRSLHYTSKINYGGTGVVFVDQIQITSSVPWQAFSAGGDSGSVIRSSDTHSLVGLLFAGNGTWTLANHQPLVVKQLQQWGYSIK